MGCATSVPQTDEGSGWSEPAARMPQNAAPQKPAPVSMPLASTSAAESVESSSAAPAGAGRAAAADAAGMVEEDGAGRSNGPTKTDGYSTGEQVSDVSTQSHGGGASATDSSSTAKGGMGGSISHSQGSFASKGSQGRKQEHSSGSKHPSAARSPASSVKSKLGGSGIAGLRQFSASELKEATQRYHKRNQIGEGGFGEVYKGEMAWEDMVKGVALPDNGGGGGGGGGGEGEEEWPSWLEQGQPPNRKCKIAVKRMKGATPEGFEGFLKEVVVLAQLCHPNLVTLHGFCKEGCPTLIYELMEGGSLDNALIDSADNCLFFPWKSRIKVALDSAKGLEYLHHRKYIHRDIKSSNILLTPEYDAKLTDFGMVRVGPGSSTLVSIVSTRVMGTKGYIDPSYMQTGHLGSKSDVYSFGVVLSELLTGIRVPEDEWQEVLPRLEQAVVAPKVAEGTEVSPEETEQQEREERERVVALVDPQLRGEYDAGGAVRLARLVVKCTQRTRTMRPAMTDVCTELETILSPP